MKKVFLILLLLIPSFAFADDSRQTIGSQVRVEQSDSIKSSLLGNGAGSSEIAGENFNYDERGVVVTFINFIKESIFGLLMLIAVGVFFVIGVRLATARGNEEELKKAFTSLIYAVVGLFIVAASWAIVRLVSGLNITL